MTSFMSKDYRPVVATAGVLLLCKIFGMTPFRKLWERTTPAIGVGVIGVAAVAGLVFGVATIKRIRTSNAQASTRKVVANGIAIVVDAIIVAAAVFLLLLLAEGGPIHY